MSDRARRACGLALLSAACLCVLGLCLASVPAPRPADRYAAAGRTAEIAPVRPESGGTVSVNLAEQEDLLELPGVGETLADAILAERDAHGWFYYPEDLLTARGVGAKKLAEFRGYLDMTVPEE